MVLSAAGLGYLGYLLFKGQPLAFSNPFVNYLAHAMLVAVPGLGIYSTLAVPVTFETPDGETLVEDATYSCSLQYDWWMSLMLWPPAILAACIAVLYSVQMLVLGGNEGATTPLSALMTALLALGLFFFFGNVIKLKAPFFVGEEGIRAGVSFFLRWDEIAFMTEKQGVFYIFTKYNPKLHIATMRPATPQALDALLAVLNQNQIPGTDRFPSMVAIVKLVTLVFSAAMLILGGILWGKMGWDPRWVIVFLFGLGILSSLVLERFRGVHKLTRIKPQVSSGLQDSRAIAQRALCLAVLVSRGRLEARLRRSPARGNESIHNEIKELDQWVEDQGISAYLSGAESALLSRPGGTWTLQEANLACWKSEALGVLLWALCIEETIPPYDHPFEWETISKAIPLLGPPEDFPALSPVSSIEHKAKSRPNDEILRAREVAELWHWRARTTHIMKQGREAPDGFTFEDIIEQAANAAFEQHDIPQPLARDFPVFDKAYGSLGPEEYKLVTSIAAERHLALNWLCAYAQDWDLTPTDT